MVSLKKLTVQQINNLQTKIHTTLVTVILKLPDAELPQLSVAVTVRDAVDPESGPTAVLLDVCMTASRKHSMSNNHKHVILVVSSHL